MRDVMKHHIMLSQNIIIVTCIFTELSCNKGVTWYFLLTLCNIDDVKVKLKNPKPKQSISKSSNAME